MPNPPFDDQFWRDAHANIFARLSELSLPTLQNPQEFETTDAVANLSSDHPEAEVPPSE